MPNLIAHRLFIDTLIGEHNISKDVKDALRLGTQGPDPLFYHGIMPFHAWHYITALRRIGNKLHKENGERFFKALIKEYETIKDEEEKEIFGGFIMGQVAHLYLDRAQHPFIYYFSGFDKDGHLTGDYHYEHAHYESLIDCLLAQKYPGFDFREATEDCLPYNKKVYSIIDKHLIPIVKELFGYKVSKKYYTNAIINMRAMQKMTRNKALKALGKKNMFNALYTPSSTEEDALNLKHEVWQHVLTGEEKTTSFIDIFNEAVNDALPRFEVYFKDGLNEEIVISAADENDYRGVKINSTLIYCKDRPYLDK